ncbi:MAG: type II secretion system protein [Blastocatellia bacterium]|nr:type II secretion system protein [Blastocatellia bacterium]
MDPVKRKNNAGFSLVELMISMVIMLLALAIVSALISWSFSVKARETQTSDALATAQAAISVISREVSNGGFGLYSDSTDLANNGIVIADSNAQQIRVRANLENEGGTAEAPGPSTLLINQPGEDVTYFFDADTKSIVRFDPNALGEGVGQTSVVVNKISNVTFEYYDYAGSTSESTTSTTPSEDTGRVRIVVEVELEPVKGQPDNQRVTFASEVTLRNNSYMLQQY